MQRMHMNAVWGVALLTGCAPTEPNQLDKLGTVPVTIKELRVRAWIADSQPEQEKGLMFVTAKEMEPLADATERGMLFIFDRDKHNGFWMKNTIINLDIAYINASGKIVQIYTMAALDERPYLPRAPYRYALELREGTFERKGIVAGDHVEIPDSIRKSRS